MKIEKLFITFLTASFVVVSGGWHYAISADGDLDLNFGVEGKVTTDFAAEADIANAVAIQQDGKIVVAGSTLNGSTYDFALARYNADGTPDTTFDSDGKVTSGFAGADSEANSVAIQSDGKIVAAGTVFGPTYDFAIIRFNTDGSLDTGFGAGGKVTTDMDGFNDEAYTLAIQNDGKIIVAGYSATLNLPVFSLARYNADGILDTSFDVDGKAIAGIDGSTAFAIAIQNDEKIVVAGESLDGFALARFHSDGSQDTSFDLDGKVTTNAGAGSSGSAVAIQQDGKIVAAGVANSDFALIRYNLDGSLDTTFDSDGIVTTDFGIGLDHAKAVFIQADGKIAAAGSAASTGSDFALARYQQDGSLDYNFGLNGKATTDFASGNDQARAAALQPDGKILTGGDANTGLNKDFALARYIASISVFKDDFDDGDTSGWNHIKPQWTESDGRLIGTPSGRKAVAVASPTFPGCRICSVDASIQTSGGTSNKIWMLGWYVDKRNTIELLMKEESDRWILKQRSNGAVVAKAKGTKPIEPNKFYLVKVDFDGSVFRVFVNDFVTPLFTLHSRTSVPAGTVGFQVKNSKGTFEHIAVN